MVSEIGSRWPHTCYFVAWNFRDLFRNSHCNLVKYSNFSFMRFFRVHVVHPYSRTDTDTTCKKSCIIWSERANFYMIDNLSIAVHPFPMRILTSLSIDEILLPRYVNWSTNIRCLALKVEMAPSCLSTWTCFICLHIEFNYYCRLPQNIQLVFGL